MGATPAGKAGGDEGRRDLNDKVFSILVKLDDHNWKERVRQFKVALNRASREAHWLQEKTESQSQSVD